MIKTLLFTILLVAYPFTAWSQASAPIVPENRPMSVDQVGLPPQASIEGTSEVVNLANGSLNMFIPAVSLPQKNGKPLVLGFTYDSTQETLQQYVTAQVTTDTDGLIHDAYFYSLQAGSSSAFNSPLQVNLPLIKASFEYQGDASINGALGHDYTIAFPAFCLVNYSFTDWSGSSHLFPYARTNCPHLFEMGMPSIGPNETYQDLSEDGEHYLLNVTANRSTGVSVITVTAPDGTVYSWAPMTLQQGMFQDIGVSTNIEQYLNLPPHTITDANGDQIQITAPAGIPGGTYAITDTIGRHISVNADDIGVGAASTPNPTITYNDSNGVQQSVTLQMDAAVYTTTSTPDVGSDVYSGTGCGLMASNTDYQTFFLYQPSPAPTSGGTSTYNLVYSGTGKRFTFKFDSYGHLLKVRYPAGGYTRYDYEENYSIPRMNGPISCLYAPVEVHHKYECAQSDGVCSASEEATTTFEVGLPASASNPCDMSGSAGTIFYNNFSNSLMSVTDPAGAQAIHCFKTLSGSSGGAIETDTFFKDADGKALKHVKIEPNALGWPLSITTTVQDVTPTLSSKITYQYDSHTDLPISVDYPSPAQGSSPVKNPTVIEEYDYAGTNIRSTSQTWSYPGSIHHLLHSKSVLDHITDTSSEVTIDHDNAGNIIDVVSSGTDVATATTYYKNLDSWGRPTKVTDARGFSSTISYSDSWADPANSSCQQEIVAGNSPAGNSYAYPTSIKNTLNQITSYKYYSCSGMLASVTNPNAQTTSYTYDAIGRLISTSYPDQGSTTMSFDDGLPNTVTNTVAASPDPDMVSSVTLDGLARPSIFQLPDGSTSERTYDQAGNLHSLTNPHLATPASTDGTTTNYYDSAHRLIVEAKSDSYFKTWCFDGVQVTNGSGHGNCPALGVGKAGAEWVDQTDESGNTWRRSYDSDANLIQVLEPNDSGAPSVETDYSYNGAGTLAGVSQHGKSQEPVISRTFTYDALSRLITSSNPETGVVCYGVWQGSNCINGYDMGGNLQARTDERRSVTNYVYDDLNRLISKTYNDGTPTAAFGYDGNDENGNAVPGLTNSIGRLSHTNSGGRVGVDYGYDAMGRLSLQRNCLPVMGGWCGSFGDTTAHYDLAGNLDSLTYPDKRTVKQGYDAAGRMNSVSYDKWYTNTKNQPYLTVDSFDPAGHIKGATFGNGVKWASSYDGRERIKELSYNKGTTPLWSKNYTWYPNSNLQREDDPLAGVQRQFTYDSLNRLTSAQDVISATAGSNGAGISGGVTPGTGGGPSPAPGASGAVPWWTNPDDSNILPALDSQTTPWETYNAVLTLDSAQAPDGTMTASTLTRLSSGAPSYTFGHSPSTSGVLYSGETLAGSVWLRSPSGTQTVAIEVIDRSEGNNFQSAQFKPVTVTSTWQQFQVVGTVRPNVSAALLEIYAGVLGQPINVWNPMLEDLGVAGSSVTNLAPYSQRLTASSWETPAGSVTDNTTTAPDGTLTASTLVLSGQTGSYVRDIVPNAVPLNGMSVASSVWLRCPSGSQSLLLALLQSDLSGSDSVIGTATVTVTDVWQRFQIARNALPSAANFKFQIGGDGGAQTVYVWGTQIEVGSAAGPYVATGATPVNRPTAYTNLLPFSQQPNQSSWIPTQLTATPNVDTAPDGTHSAAMVTGTSAASDGTLLVSIPNPNLYNKQEFTASVYLRCLSGTMSLNLYMQNHGSDGYTLPALKTADLTTSWKRFQFTGTFQNGLQEAYLQIGGGGSITANTSFEMWGTQVELAPQAGPYVATSALPIITGRDLTNILPNSQQLNGPGWYPVANGSVSTNANSSPDQTSSAATVTASNIPDPNTSISVAVANPSLYDEQVVTASVFLRSRTGLASINLYLVQVNDGGSNYNTTAKTVNLSSSWQRYELTGTMVNGMVQMYLQLGGGFSVTQGQSFDVWGPQLVIGSEAGPYTPSGSTPGNVTNFATNQPGSLSPYGLNEAYQYDSFGNMTQHGNFTATYTANNQMFGYAYDPAGNLLSNGYSPMSWDAENRLSTVGGTRYTYDAEGRRVSSQGADTPDTIYFGDRPIQRLVNNQLTDLIYGPTGLIAEVPATEFGVPAYRATDHLGSAVGTLTADGSLVNPIDLTPFGKTFSGSTSDPFVFTGKERDTESGLDYFGARYYGSSMGRYMSPDWSDETDPVPYADMENPQTLNLYGYVTNNPLRLYDPTGHDGCCVLPSMAEVDAGIAYLEGGLETAATVSAGAVVGTVGLIGSQIFAPSRLGYDPAEQRYLAMMSKGGHQNHSDSYFENLSDKELEDLLKDPRTSPSDRAKIVKQQKANKDRNSQKRGPGKKKAPPVKNDPASVRARQQQANPMPMPMPDPPKPDPPKPPKDDHGDHP